MKEEKSVLKKLGAGTLALLLAVGLLPLTRMWNVNAEGSSSGDEESDAYKRIMDMDSRPPSDWEVEKDPYGYGLMNDFMLLEQDELLINKSTTVDDGEHFLSYGQLKSGTTNHPINGAGETWTKDLGGHYTLAFTQSVAFDPTKSGRKDHVAVLGVYSSKYGTEDYPPKVYMYVMDNQGRCSDLTLLENATWMCNDNTLNNRNMWDFNAMNFLGITAGDYNGDGKDSVVYWACASTPSLKQVNVSSNNGNISLSVLNVNGYGKLTHPKYSDPDDRYVYDRLHAAIDTGDVNGDGIDDLVVLSYVNRVHDDYKSKVTEYYVPHLAVSYGVKDSSDSITAGKSAKKDIYVTDTTSGEWHMVPMASGLAVGDVSGNGKDDIVISGFYNNIKGEFDKKVSGPYDNMNEESLVVAIYNGKAERLTFNTSLEANRWTHGGDGANGGYFLFDGGAGDHSWQQMGVETVAINGKANAEMIFIGGSLYKYDGGNLNCVFTPDYFTEVDEKMDSQFNEETYIRSMAVGNFDHNQDGYEQIVFVVGGADSVVVGDVTFAMGMIGGIYEDDTGMKSPTAVSYYCTSPSEIEGSSYYHKGTARCDKVCSFDICAWDRDHDGLHARYVGKDYVYSDPEVMAILQANPFFEEMKDFSGGSTSFSTTVTNSHETADGNSVSFGIGPAFESEAKVVSIDVTAQYATDWSESFSKGVSVSKTVTYAANGEDQVIVSRTPITLYTYQIEVDGNWSDNNTVTLSFSGEPSVEALSVSDYNEFAEYYNKHCIELADEMNETLPDNEKIKPEDVPHINTIDDKWLGHAGDPFSYMQTSSAQQEREILQDSPNTLTVGKSFSEFEWSKTQSAGHEVSSSHGFSVDFAIKFGWESNHVGFRLGVETSLSYMRDSSECWTEEKGTTVTCSIDNMNPDDLADAGISKNTASQYTFQYQLVTWPSDIPSTVRTDKYDIGNNIDDDIDVDDDTPTYVPIYGYMLSGVRAGTPPVTDLKAAKVVDSTNNVSIKLSWSDPSTIGRPVGAYALYRHEDDGSYEHIATLPKETTSYTIDSVDGRPKYEFVIRTKSSENAGVEGINSNRAFVYINGNALYSIILAEETELYDLYKVFDTEGLQTTLKVRHGVGIDNIDLTASSDDGLKDTYTIHFTDGSVHTYFVKNGNGITSIDLDPTRSDADKSIYTVKMQDGTTYDLTVNHGEKGDQGLSAYEVAVKETGFTGTPAEWIASLTGSGIGLDHIEKVPRKTGDPETLDTYQMVYSDGTIFEFTVNNGVNGIGIAKWEKTGTDPNDSLIDIYTVTYTDGSTTSFTVKNAKDAVGIKEITKSSNGLEDTYTITLTDDSSYDMVITNGVDGIDGLSAYELAVAYGFQGNEAEWIASLTGNGIGILGIEKIDRPVGIPDHIDTYRMGFTDGSSYTFTVNNGLNGKDGVGVDSISKTNTEGLVDTYTIKLSDGTETNLEVTNGKDGEAGKSAYEIAVENGFKGNPAEWVASLAGKGVGLICVNKFTPDGSLPENIDTYGMYFSDGSVYTFTVENGVGKDGLGVKTIEKTGTDGLVDTYTIIMTDGSKSEYTVTNGARGSGITSIEKTATEGLVDTYTITYTDGFTSQFTMINGEKGEEGKTAYEVAVDNGFKGNEAEWLASLRGEEGVGIEKIEQVGSNEKENTFTITFTDSTKYTFTLKNGTPGKSMVSLVKTSNSDLTDTYTVTYSDRTTSSFDVKNGQDGIKGLDGKDGVGIANVTIDNQGDQIVTLTDGSTINAGSVSLIPKKTTEITSSGEVITYYLQVPFADFQSLEVNGETVNKEDYSIEEYGEGVMLTINNDKLPEEGELQANGATTSDSVVLAAQRSPNLGSNSSAPQAWLIIVLSAMGAAIIFLGIRSFRKKTI